MKDNSMEKLKEFPIDSNYFRHVSEGNYGSVYQLNKKHVGKFLFFPETMNSQKLQMENEVCKIAYENGISVPKPEGVFNVMRPKSNNLCPTFIMEYIKGKTFGELQNIGGNSKLCKKIFDLAKKEINKAGEIGLKSPEWYTGGNIIWSPEEKVYLIDFGLWEITK